MATSPDHPELQFVQAKYFSKGRPDGPPLWIVVHDMEAGESSSRAESTAAYFATMPDGRSVSSHYTVDNDSVIQCVRLSDVAWTVGNRPGNNRGINWELAGFARQNRDEWLDEFGRAMFDQMAPIVRADAAKFGIPLRRCSNADLIARRPGITSHNDLRVAFGGTTHTDPGPAFPWDYFLALLRSDGMQMTDIVPATGGRDVQTVLSDVFNGEQSEFSGFAPTVKTIRQAQLADIQAKVNTIAAAPPVTLSPEDVAAMADAIAAKLATNTTFLTAVAEAVAEEQHQRQAE